MAIRYSIAKFNALSPQIRTQLEEAALAEFGHVPIVQKYKWSDPTYSFLATDEDVVASSVNLVAREIKWNSVKLHAAGVNNLITHKHYRGRGYAWELMDMAMKHAFASMGADVGVLFCADGLVSFYEDLGWKRTDAKVWFSQQSGKLEWTSNRMWISRSSTLSEPQTIDLCGLPW
jgi:GNAT superfamily N-acetyltransferase